VVLHTHGRNGQYHPHLHLLATSGGYDSLGLGRLNRCQKFPRYLALRYALRFCQAMEVADNTLCSGMVTSSSTSEHAPCNNS
jgi:hypothetical protein